MDIQRFDGRIHADGVIDLLMASDTDFNPPLSSRTSVRNHDFTHDGPGSIEQYYADLSQRDGYCIMVGGVVAGCCFYEWEPSGSIYLCLILAGSEYRGMGLASELYDSVEGLARDHHASVLLRTWSDNMHQLRLLERRGYVRVRELLHDRGEGRHTWYFEKTM